MLKDLIGDHGCTGAALDELITLSKGSLPADCQDPTGLMGRINGPLSQGLLPETQEVLVDRVRRGLMGSAPLTHNAGDLETLRGIVARLIHTGGLVGGPGMAVAIVRRYARLRKIGGPKAELRALVGIGALFGSDWEEFMFLIAIAEGPLLANHEVQIFDQMGDLVNGLGSVDRALRGIPKAEARLPVFLRAVQRVSQLPLPDTHRDRVLGRLTGMVAEAQRALVPA